MNDLQKLIERYPDKDWDLLSRNPNITIDIIEKYIDEDWC